ncbi:hypothetical protein BH11PLA2_BH11PLA2_39170 [soil metagenome]
MDKTRFGLLAVLSTVMLTGCDSAPRDTAQVTGHPATAAATPTLARPDAYRIGYDPATRILSLYELPDDQVRWMISSQRNLKGEPVNNGYTFASEVDLDNVAVFYTTARGQSSPRITLREVLTMQIAHGR